MQWQKYSRCAEQANPRSHDPKGPTKTPIFFGNDIQCYMVYQYFNVQSDQFVLIPVSIYLTLDYYSILDKMLCGGDYKT